MKAQSAPEKATMGQARKEGPIAAGPLQLPNRLTICGRILHNYADKICMELRAHNRRVHNCCVLPRTLQRAYHSDIFKDINYHIIIF